MLRETVVFSLNANLNPCIRFQQPNQKSNLTSRNLDPPAWPYVHHFHCLWPKVNSSKSSPTSLVSPRKAPLVGPRCVCSMCVSSQWTLNACGVDIGHLAHCLDTLMVRCVPLEVSHAPCCNKGLFFKKAKPIEFHAGPRSVSKALSTPLFFEKHQNQSKPLLEPYF